MESDHVNPTEHYPLELHYIKLLYLQNQHRQTIRACQDLLRTFNNDGNEEGNDNGEAQLRKAFCLFYLAASHDDLARSMHRHSQGKLPAFTTAELFYQRALDALPSPSESIQMSKRITAKRKLHPVNNTALTESSSQTSIATNQYSHELPASTGTPPPLSPPSHLRDANVSFHSPSNSLPRSTSEISDLESHGSFNEILTPNRMLQRDFSQMSLLEPNPPPKSVSRALPRPSGYSSPLKQYPVAPQYQAHSAATQQRTTLPKLVTHPRVDSGLPSASSSRFVSPEPVSPEEPVSPLTPKEAWEPAAISPVSPESPPYEDAPWGQAHPVASPDDDEYDEDELETPTPHDCEPIEEEVHEDVEEEERGPPGPDPAVLDAHLSALRAQIKSHIALVRDQLDRAKAEKALSSRPSTAQDTSQRQSLASTGRTPSSGSSSSSSAIQQTRSYWSFTPVEVRVEEKKSRIRAGREREWTRARFRPERYRDLAEQALAEL